ncbi:hypothetical protein R1flu_019469 [Riccia fluitans]|uniref:Uncharacterized protein n=1 Tax=Riccia fluitans TaxID=41844 RepID=A0ABD1ZKA8_9MARC
MPSSQDSNPEGEFSRWPPAKSRSWMEVALPHAAATQQGRPELDQRDGTLVLWPWKLNPGLHALFVFWPSSYTPQSVQGTPLGLGLNCLFNHDFAGCFSKDLRELALGVLVLARGASIGLIHDGEFGSGAFWSFRSQRILLICIPRGLFVGLCVFLFTLQVQFAVGCLRDLFGASLARRIHECGYAWCP